MKHLALDLKTVIKDGKKDLDELNDDYGNANSFIGFTMEKLNILANSPSSKLCCYLCLVVFLFLMILYFLS